MDIKQLEFFSVACEKGSLSQAAACLYTSQPHISKTIRTLENELGRPLLSRSGKGVRPTAYGETVLEYANLILKAAATISTLSLPDTYNSLRLSTYPSNMISRLHVDFYNEWGRSFTSSITKEAWRRLPIMFIKAFLRLGLYMLHSNRFKPFSTFLLIKI